MVLEGNEFDGLFEGGLFVELIVVAFSARGNSSVDIRVISLIECCDKLSNS